MNFLSTEEAAAAIGCTKRQLQWWDEHKVFRAHHDGHRRYYNRLDIPQGRVIARLRACNETFTNIRRALRGVVLDAPFYVYERGKRLQDCRTQHDVIDRMINSRGAILIELR